MTELDGKRILVFGASGGLGEAIATNLSDSGAVLVRSSRRIDGADLTLPDTPRSVIADASAAHGGLDGIVIAAGAVAFGPASGLDDDTVDELLLINYLAPLRIIRAALIELEPGGFVLNISAIVADKPTAGMAAYSASKAAVSAFAAAVRPEARKAKIRIIDVRPPHTETGLATRPIAGDAPTLPQGLTPAQVATRIVAAIVDDETDVAAEQFS